MVEIVTNVTLKSCPWSSKNLASVVSSNDTVSGYKFLGTKQMVLYETSKHICRDGHFQHDMNFVEK